MTTAAKYLVKVEIIQSDLETMGGFSDDLDTALGAALDVLEAPGDIEDKLREKANAVDLPNSVVTALGVLPFGIGTAIKQLDNAAKTVENAVDAQADIMGTLDASWAPTRNVVSNLESYNSTANTTINGLLDKHSNRLTDAEALAASMGNQSIYEGSELLARMEGFESIADVWITSRETVLAPLQTALNDFNDVIDDLNDVVPDLSEVTGAMDSVISVFSTAKGVADDIEDALDFTINLPWPIPDVNLLDALETIGSYADFIVDLISGFVTDALSLIGVNINSVFDSIQQEMLSLLSPLFRVLDDLKDAAAGLAASITASMNDVQLEFAAALGELSSFVTDDSLFANTIYGDVDSAGNNFADDITGSFREEGIYGLEGNDKINGGGGNDFLFGGSGRDTVIGGNGDDEMFGNGGNDVLFALSGDNLMDAGAGEDIVIGRQGQDTLIGGSGDDRLIGGGESDVFVFLRGGDFDTVVDFRNNVDTLEIDSRLVDGATTGQQVVDDFGLDLGNNTLLNFGEDRLLLVGVSNPNALADDILII